MEVAIPRRSWGACNGPWRVPDGAPRNRVDVAAGEASSRDRAGISPEPDSGDARSP